MKIKTLLMMALALLAIGCQQQQTRYQEIEKLGREKMEYIEKEGFPRVQRTIINNLKFPESYEPISTDMSIVTSDMIIYDSQAFVALRDLDRAIRDFDEEYGNDSTSQEARNQLNAIQNLKDLVQSRIRQTRAVPVEFAGIDVYHQLYANDKPDHKTKKGYHIIFHKDNSTTLLCDHDEFLKAKALLKQLINGPSNQH